MRDERRIYFDSVAEDWNKRVQLGDSIKSIVNKFDIQTGQKILDVGSGTGRLSALLCEAVGIHGCVVSVDFSRAMLFEAQRNGKNKNHTCVCADVLELSFVSDYFDKVICFSAFPHFRDQKIALSEIYRVLKPSGKLYIAHVQGSRSLNEFHRNLGGVVKNDILPTGTSMSSLLETCRFRGIDVVDRPDLYWADARK